MLRNVLIITDGGLVLFSKVKNGNLSISAVSQPRLVGSLLTAIVEFSTNNVGSPVSYIEMSSVAVSICSSRSSSAPCNFEGAQGHRSLGPRTDALPHHLLPLSRQYSESQASSLQGGTKAKTKESFLICALFHDVEDGPELGRLVGRELLSSFQDQFGSILSKIGGGTPHINLNEFDGFHGRIPGILRGIIGPVVARLSASKGIQASLLLTDDDRIAYCTADGIDSLSLGANLVALVTLAHDAVGLRGDMLRTVDLEGGPSASTRILLRKLRYAQATLVAVCQTAVRRNVCEEAVSAAARLCDECFRLLDNMGPPR
mmetsp:Transcript_39911/g.106648  ORF Transcript_39911/g.106648 Transcript_39911/m.106648 type:complete len:316 (-) Transcript_39911:1287-2234(-)